MPRPPGCCSAAAAGAARWRHRRRPPAPVVEFVAGNDHFFLNLSMASCKAMLDAAAGVPGSSMVTVMARNGVNFGIQPSGTGRAWVPGAGQSGRRPVLPGYGVADAADLGDSAITETAGLGGFAMPRHRRSFSSSAARRPTPPRTAGACARSPSARQPGLHAASAELRPDRRRHRRAPGARLRRAADHQHRHRAPRSRRRQIGAGVTTAPMDCFVAAIDALATGAAVTAATATLPGARAERRAAPAGPHPSGIGPTYSSDEGRS